MSIAIRRHHRARLRKARKLYWHWNEKTPRQLGILANTPATCSCWMCGNWRRVMKQRPIQELRQTPLDTWED